MNAPKDRYFFWLFLAFCLPFAVIALQAGSYLMESEKGFVLTVLSPLVFGGGAIYLLAKKREKVMRYSVDRLVESRIESTLKEFETAKAELTELKAVELQEKQRTEKEGFLEAKLQEIESVQAQLLQEKDELEKRANLLEEEKRDFLFKDTEKETRYKKEAKAKDELLAQYQKSIDEMKFALEKKQQYIGKLEARIQDLSYEVRTLLQLNGQEEMPQEEILAEEEEFKFEFPQEHHSFFSSAERLKKEVEEMVGASHLGRKFAQSWGSFSDTLAIDLRELSDILNQEGHFALFAYHTVDQEFLYTNSTLRELVGFSHDMLEKNAHEIFKNWQELKSKMERASGEEECELSIQTKYDDEKKVKGMLVPIGKGVFKGLMLVLLESKVSDDILDF